MTYVIIISWLYKLVIMISKLTLRSGIIFKIAFSFIINFLKCVNSRKITCIMYTKKIYIEFDLQAFCKNNDYNLNIKIIADFFNFIFLSIPSLLFSSKLEISFCIALSIYLRCDYVEWKDCAIFSFYMCYIRLRMQTKRILLLE